MQRSESAQIRRVFNHPPHFPSWHKQRQGDRLIYVPCTSELLEAAPAIL